MRYVSERLTGTRGQLHYFEATAKNAAGKLTLAHRCFWVFSAGALLATSLKLVLMLGFMPAAHAAALGSWAGLLATALPVAAVGFLSWAASSDLEARAKTYADMHTFLASQVRRLDGAGSRRRCRPTNGGGASHGQENRDDLAR